MGVIFKLSLIVHYATVEESNVLWFPSAKFMGRGKAEPCNRSRNRITFLYCPVLYFNEWCLENTRQVIVIFTFPTTLLSRSTYLSGT